MDPMICQQEMTILKSNISPEFNTKDVVSYLHKYCPKDGSVLNPYQECLL
jgi:hypothetical protein